jgi:hypothetical protein
LTRPNPEATVGAFDAAVVAEIQRGATSPSAVVAALEKRLGREWLVGALAELLTEVAESRVADIMRSRRLAAERVAAKQTGTTKVRRGRGRGSEAVVPSMPTLPLLEQLVYVPARHARIRYRDCTAADLRSRGDLYDRIAGSASTRSTWCYDVATTMDAAHATVLGELESVPPLPDGKVLDEFVEVAA